jgi:FkbM family methyltransferase
MISRAIQKAKSGVRDGLPATWQVSAKYWHTRLTGRLEPEIALLPDLLADGGRMIDIGANYGLYGRAASRLGASVELFEPHGRCLRALEAWAAGRPNVRVHGCALSSAAGQASLSIPLEADGVEHDAAASLEPRHGGGFRVETVPVRTLDSFGFNDASLIKIDVEGHEAQVIEGALSTIARSRPALLVEIEQRHCSGPIEVIFERICALGYAGHFLHEGRLADLSHFRLADHQPLAALGRRDIPYLNNFLFLAHSRLAAGSYRALRA